MKENKATIKDFIDKLYASIKRNEEVISINIHTHSDELLNRFGFLFKYIDFSNAKIEILPYQVPIWVKAIDEKDIHFYESNVKAIIEEIDGLSYVKKIANKLEMDIKLVTYVLYNLALVNSIAFVDIFQFSNKYRACSTLKQLYYEDFINEFNSFCELNLSLFNNRAKFKPILDVYQEHIKEESKLNSSILFSLYCELTNSQDVSDFILKVKDFGINIPLFIAFGVYKKLIRRVHIYVYVKNKEKDQSNSL
jgi:hypothetical protein